MQQFKISASLTDLPVLTNLDHMFHSFKQTGVDGIEIVIGARTRFSYERISYLSKKYSLPILSIHQPLWSGFGLYFDKRFLDFVKELAVVNIVFHPLPILNLKSMRARKYFNNISRLQNELGFHVLLENMTLRYSRSKPKILSESDRRLLNIFGVYEIAKEYNFFLTFDTSHAAINKPQEEQWFEKIYPLIKNIHLSSFDNKREHLPLMLGKFDTKGFIRHLEKKRYAGLVTLEINYPKYVNLRNFDFEAITQSVAMIRSIKPNSLYKSL